MQMGFSKNRCMRALLSNSYFYTLIFFFLDNDFNFALNWLFENEGNPGYKYIIY